MTYTDQITDIAPYVRTFFELQYNISTMIFRVLYDSYSIRIVLDILLLGIQV